MEAIEILTKEHDLIKEYLVILEKGLKAMEWAEGEKPPPEFFERALEFAREYADRHHHHKEELILFTKLAEKKQGELDAAIERLRQQHEHNRDYLTAASQALSGYTHGETTSAMELHFNMTKYLQNLRRHIQVEEDIFFGMAEDALSESEKEYLNSEFDKIENRAGNDFYQKMKNRIDQLQHLIK